MTDIQHFGWDRLRHDGLLLDTERLNKIASHTPEQLPYYTELSLRKQVDALYDGNVEVSGFVSFVLEQVCGFTSATGSWLRGNQVGAEWTRRAVTGEAVKPRQLWQNDSGGTLPIFFDAEKRVGIGRGRKSVSQVLQWLRAGKERLAIVTNGRQWRLLFAGLDYAAWCEWDADLWFEEGSTSPQVVALRTLLSTPLWTPEAPEEATPLLQAIQDSRKGQANLSAELGERVREAVETLVQAHGEVLKEKCADISSAEIYRAAVRVVMRIVVTLFAESRELLPRDHALYHGAYGVNGLRESLEKETARGNRRMARSWNAWPRLIGLFRLIHKGSHHPALLVPQYGGELFAPGVPDSRDGLSKALNVFETACFHRQLMSDRDVHLLLERITRTRVKVRQGRGSTWVPAPVDFSDLSSEYIGILYEGLLDFELKTAPEGDPVVFLAVGNQPALPLSRLEAMKDKALANLLDKMKDTSSDGDDTETLETGSENDDSAVDEDEDAEDGDADGETDTQDHDEDSRQTTRTRAEMWARRAVTIGKLVRKPQGRMNPEKRLVYEEKIAKKARQLVSRVVLPGEWYLVRWGGTRKGAGTFYTRPGLAVPTVQRTLKPLAYDPPLDADGQSDRNAPASAWFPKRPEDILALKVCDPACGSGTFPVAALRYLTDALYSALHQHDRIHENADHSIIALITGDAKGEDLLASEQLPCRAENQLFESKLKAVLRRHVVERCIYGVDIDPMAVELCRLSLWIETMDRELPFSFLDHKIKCGNSLVGAWFDQFQHYPVMAWKNREGGDKSHTNGVHFAKETMTKAIKAFVKDVLTTDLLDLIENRVMFNADAFSKAQKAHNESMKALTKLHELGIRQNDERARIYREEIVRSDSYRKIKCALDLWCACWFWPGDLLEHAPLPTTISQPDEKTIEITESIAARKRFFHWELEFPDVFDTNSAGFDAILGNPPWDIAKPNSKEFFSNIDPLYRAYGKQEAIRYQTSYFADDRIERDWIEYNADFRAQSNYMRYVSSSYGDPEENEKSTDRFSIKRGKANPTLHRRWREAREKTAGFSDPSHPFRHQGSADINLYKLFLELAHALLRKGGRLGFIVPSGLYSDHGTGALRTLLLNRCKWEWIFGFENKDGVFDIHRSFKFNPIIIEKGGETEAINTAFMRRKLEDWEQGETFATSYSRAQVTRFSPLSSAILEIQSSRDLEILEKIYSNSVLLGDNGTDGWGIKYSREFDMSNDSKLFHPRPKWEAKGYKADEYSRWLKGDWRPIEELLETLDIEPLKEGEFRCAQPPYDRLPIPRGGIPIGVILSREADEWIDEEDVENISLPLYQGLMIWNFDYSFNGWLSGTGRSAIWEPIDWANKVINPQFLVSYDDYNKREKAIQTTKVCLRRITTAIHQRTAVVSLVPDRPCGDVASIIQPKHFIDRALLTAALNLFPVDYVAKKSCTYLHLDWHVAESLPAPKLHFGIIPKLFQLICPTQIFSNDQIRISSIVDTRVFPAAITESERKRLTVNIQAVGFATLGFTTEDIKYLFKDADRPAAFYNNEDVKKLDPKGFWRIDKHINPELRQTILSLVAFHDLETKISECAGDRNKGIEAFLNQNDGEGWMLPESLRLADYGLGHDDRAKEHQPVSSRLGPRFYDWQLAQSSEESWNECHLHARNILGHSGYYRLLGEVLSETDNGRWYDALTFACDLYEKENLVSVFANAFGLIPPHDWENRIDEAQTVSRERGTAMEAADRIRILVVALAKIPQEQRPDGLAAAFTILDDAGFQAALEKLLAKVPSRTDHPWHTLIREQVGETIYGKITAGLKMEGKTGAAPSPVSSAKKKAKHEQIKLFD